MGYTETGIMDVLVIDDDADLRRVIVELMVAEGHQVVAAESAEQGLEHLPYVRFDVALLDHQLPGMEGLVFGEYLRRNNPDMAIALVTGAADDRIARLTREHGIRLIEKPFDPDQLVEFVDHHRVTLAASSRRLVDTADLWFAPPVRAHVDSLAEHFSIAAVPHRLEERLAHKVREALNAVRQGGPAAEQARVQAFSGLLTARVLGVTLPRSRDGASLYDVYDRLMARDGRRLEFGPPDDA